MQDLTIEFILYTLAIVGVGVFVWIVPMFVGPPLSSLAVIGGLTLLGILIGYFLGS